MLRPEAGVRPVPVRGRRSGPWIDHLAIGVALAALLLGFDSVVEGRAWFWTVAPVAVLVGLVSALARTFGSRLVAPLGLVAGSLATTWIFVPQTLVAGALPTPGSLSALWSLLDRSRILIMEEAAPAPAARPIILVLTLAFTLLVVVADALVRRRLGTVLLGVLLVAVFLTPALVSGQAPSVVTFVVPAAAWLVVLWHRGADGGPRSGLLPSVALGACGLLVGALLPPVLPDVTGVARDWGDPPPTVFGQGINPMLQLGQNLRRGETGVAATYTTTLDDAPYLRVAVLRDFNGRTWRPVGPEAMGREEGSVAISPRIETEPASTDIRIEDLRSTMLPTPYPATGVSGLSQEWRWNRVGQTLMSQSADSAEEEYTVRSLDVQPTAAQMRSLPEPFVAGLQDYLELPADVPESLGRLAREVTADADNDYDRALALQEHFQTLYQYSETAPVAGDFDGNGVRVLERFLEERAGYCVHFSSAMAVMARTLGIPARVVVGYAPGRAVGFEDGDQVFEVTSDDLHAWPELFFEGVGWVGFEPTPSVGSPTEFEEPTSAPRGGADGDRDTGGESARAAEEGGGEQAPVVTDEVPSGARSALAAVVVLLLVGLVPGVVRLALRRRRLAAPGPEPWWREVEATARDHGLEVLAAETPRVLAARLAGGTGVDPGALERLLRDVEQARYARGGTLVEADPADARRVVVGVAAHGRWRDRVRARLLPRSLVRRR